MQEALRSLQLRGYIDERFPERYRLHRKDMITGVVDVLPDNTLALNSIYHKNPVPIVPEQLRGARYGDTVYSVVKKGERKQVSAEVVRVIRFAQRSMPGTIEVLQEKAWFIPEQDLFRDIMVPLNQLNGAEDGDAVVVEIIPKSQQHRTLHGRVTEVLGHRGDPHLDMAIRMKRQNFSLFFSKEQEQEALNAIVSAQKPYTAEPFKRIDMRGVSTFTIDPPDCKDADDALSIRRLDNGNLEIGVHIVDIDHYLERNSDLDKEAYLRGACVYLADRIIPMLPESFIAHCSLTAGSDKRTFSVLFEMDENGKVLHSKLSKTLIRSHHAFTYDDADKILKEGEGHMAWELITLARLSQKLRTERFRNGAISFEGRTQTYFKFDEHGHPIDAYVHRHNQANSLIEEFMLLANRTVAEKVAGSKDTSATKKPSMPFLYRTHGLPQPSRFDRFTHMIRHLGYPVDEAHSSRMLAKQMSKLLNNVHGQPDERLLNMLALQSMSKAKYHADRKSHYALGFMTYTHFTSPLRRYADVIVHRLLAHYILKQADTPLPGYDMEKLEAMSDYLTSRTTKAKEAQNDYAHLKSLEYMEDHIGEKFMAKIYDINAREMKIELTNSGILGRVFIAKIEGHNYFYEARNCCVTNPQHTVRYKLGDDVRVVLKQVDTFTKIITFNICNN
jgi:ribonuclease R